MSLNFDDYDSILSSLSNGANGGYQENQPVAKNVKQEYSDEGILNNKDINFNNSLFAGFNPVTSINLNQLDMGAANNYNNEKLSSSTYDSLSPSYTNTDSSPEAILFGDQYNQGPPSYIKHEDNGFPFDNGMDVDNLLAEDFNFETTDPSTNSTQFEAMPRVDSSLSSPNSFNSSPDSVTAFQPQLNDIDDLSKAKGKRGRKPSVKSEPNSTSPPSLSKTLSSSTSGVVKPGKKIKSSHNLIEKKYRTNINSKIIELRNCVPSLRILISKNHNLHNGQTQNSNGENDTGEFDDDYEGEGYTDDERKLDGLKPAKKLNKATILSKATEYIRHLEYKLEVVQQENDKLRELVVNSNQSANENIQLHQNSPQSMTNSPPQNQNRNSSMTNNLIMGGLTCLVGASTLDDFDSNNGTFRRSLFSVPIFSFGSNQSSSIAFKPLLGLMKILLVFAVLFYMVEPFFKSQKNEKKKTTNNFKWSDVLRAIQYMTSLNLIVEDFFMISESEAYHPLLILSADLQSQTLLKNFAKLMLKSNTTSILLLKSIYLRFIADRLSVLKYPIMSLSQSYWTKAGNSIQKDYQNENVKELVSSYQHVLNDDSIFNKYTEILETKNKEYVKYSTPFEILSKLIIESRFTESLQSLIELETLKKQETPNEETIKSLNGNLESNLVNAIHLSSTLNTVDVELLFLKALIDPSKTNISDALTAVKSTTTEVNSNSLVCGLLKLQVLTNDLDKSKILLLLKKLNLSEIDFLSFTSLYSIINIFPKSLLQEEDTDDTLSDSSIEYRENYSIEFKLNQFILSILASLRIFIGKKENDFGLNNELKSTLIDDFVNEINELDC